MGRLSPHGGDKVSRQQKNNVRSNIGAGQATGDGRGGEGSLGDGGWEGRGREGRGGEERRFVAACPLE